MWIFDGHLDVAMNALLYERDQTLPVEKLRRREAGGAGDDRGGAMVSLPELRGAGVAVIVGTLIARAKPWVNPARKILRNDLDYPDASMAYAAAQGQLAYYRLLESRGLLRIITDAASLDEHLRAWQSPRRSSEPLPVGVILLMEGADPIVEPQQVRAWWSQGLRVLGLAHFGHSRYAAGTPSRDPSSPEQDGSLTLLGLELLKHMRELPIALDLTHLSDTSFYQAVDAFDGPVCASHSNCRSIAPGPRQLSDRQIRLIVERDGVIGVAMHYAMIRQGQGLKAADVRLGHVAEHIDHICQLAGSARHVALGTDLDGGFGAEATPADLQSYADLHQLAPLLSQRGFDEADVAAFFHGNWLRFFRRTLPPTPIAASL